MINIKTLFVGGNFDDKAGRQSKIANIIADTIEKDTFSNLSMNMNRYNGGNLQDLEQIVDTCQDYDAIFWFPNVSNTESKLVKKLKVINPQHVLITSKNNLENKYNFTDLVYHALNNHANLFVEFTKDHELIKGRIIDPLGNVFLNYSEDFHLVSLVLKKRVEELSEYVRLPSIKLEGNSSQILTHESDYFLDIVKTYANKFHELIHPKGDAQTRFMGNASFRCTHGFPSARMGNGIMVSRRNIDKRELNFYSFVFVKNELPIQYYGNFKPSVDTPVQVGLYNYYTNINYMIHSHTYIKDAPFTQNVIPCGALEEISDIVDIFPGTDQKNFSINLRGHGSIVLASTISHLENIKYYARPIPEIHEEYRERATQLLEVQNGNQKNRN